MMKWAMPLDYQRAVDILCETLISQLAFDSVPKAQSENNIKWRTIVARNTDLLKQCAYPFDQQPFKIDNQVNDSVTGGDQTNDS